MQVFPFYLVLKHYCYFLVMLDWNLDFGLVVLSLCIKTKVVYRL